MIKQRVGEQFRYQMDHELDNDRYRTLEVAVARGDKSFSFQRLRESASGILQRVSRHHRRQPPGQLHHQLRTLLLVQRLRRTPHRNPVSVVDARLEDPAEPRASQQLTEPRKTLLPKPFLRPRPGQRGSDKKTGSYLTIYSGGLSTMKCLYSFKCKKLWTRKRGSRGGHGDPSAGARGKRGGGGGKVIKR
jgi:hypothetical protein